MSLYYVECHYAEGAYAEFCCPECLLAKFNYAILRVIRLSFVPLSVILLSFIMFYVEWSYAEFCCPGCHFVMCHYVILSLIL